MEALKRPGAARDGILRDRDFRHLWAADALSQLGTRISMLAVPLLAVLTLHASAFEVSLLRTAETLAWLLFGLAAGTWMDRVRCRPVLVASDLGRAALLVSIPIAAAVGAVTMVQLYAVLLLGGVLTVLFDVAHGTFLPRLVSRDRLVEGNGRLATNASIAAVAGDGIGGYLVQWFTAPIAILLDAISFLWSAVWLSTIHKQEIPPPAPTAEQRQLRRDMAEGIRFVFKHRYLRPIALCSATAMLFQSANAGIMIVFLVREIHLSPGTIGLLGMLGLLGAIAASILTERISNQVGHARAIVLAAVTNGVGFLTFALTAPGWRLSLYVLATLITSFSIVVLHILQVSARQMLCPAHLIGRVGATMEFMIWGVMPVGSVLGGLLATVAGLRATLLIDGAAILLASLWLLLSPFRLQPDLTTVS
jgi:MFS family permease